VVVLLTGRPYVLDWALDAEGPRPHAVLQSFFPGEEGGTAIADVLSGDAAPSGRLPISLPRSTGAQPYTYLHPILGGDSDVTAAHSRPVRPFGFGLSYTTFAYRDLVVDAEVTVTNTGSVAGTDVVQLYGHDVQAQIARPVAQLLGYARVHLDAGESVRVRFRVPSVRFAFSDRSLTRIVEPGDVQVWIGAHSEATAADAETAADARDDGGFGVSADGGHRPTEPRVAGAATARATVALTGRPHAVTGAEARTVRCEKVDVATAAAV
jgi:beta-glucosidase